MCPHNSQVGDNYGLTCMDCGATLAGYGYWGEGLRECQHHFVNNGEGIQVCLYCEREESFVEREREPESVTTLN